MVMCIGHTEAFQGAFCILGSVVLSGADGSAWIFQRLCLVVCVLSSSSAGGTPTCFAVRERPAKLPLLFVSISGHECFVLIVFMCRLCLSGLCVFLGLYFRGGWCSALEVA